MIWISPHLDDAVLSCGEQIAADPDAWVVTVLAGAPGIDKPVTAYDVRAGFTGPMQAVVERQREDIRAAAVLDARTIHIGLLDGQYGQQPDEDAVIQYVIPALPKDLDVAFPLGLAHDDHIVVSDAMLRATRSRFKDRRVFLYEDLPSRVVYPDLVPMRMAEIAHAHRFEFHPRHPAQGDTDLKEVAIRCYRSQTQQQVGLPWRCALVTERLWEII